MLILYKLYFSPPKAERFLFVDSSCLPAGRKNILLFEPVENYSIVLLDKLEEYLSTACESPLGLTESGERRGKNLARLPAKASATAGMDGLVFTRDPSDEVLRMTVLTDS